MYSRPNRNRLLIVPLLFLAAFLVYLISPVIESSDSRLSLHVSMSLIRQGNTQLDSYTSLVDGYYALEHIDNHIYNIYPIGPSLLALPFVWIFNIATDGEFEISLRTTWPVALEFVIACFIVALSAVFMYLIARLYLPLLSSLLVFVIFAFGTSAWSISSRALWQHGPSMLILSIALYLLARREDKLIPYVGTLVAFSYLIRPSNSISVIVFAGYVFICHRRQFVKFLIGAAVIGVPFVLSNLSIYHALLSPYYTSQKMGIDRFPQAFIGYLISPTRGLLIYSPIFLLTIVGVLIKRHRRTFDHLDAAVLAILILHWIAISFFQDWAAGLSYGARYFADVTPFGIFFMIPVISWLTEQRRRVAWAITIVLLTVSLYSNYYGATHQETVYVYKDPYSPPYPLWNWQNVEYLKPFLEN